MYTYPCTCPNPKKAVTSKESLIPCHTVSYPEDEQQSTNNNMRNGEVSDHGHRHFEAQNNETVETQYLLTFESV